MRRLAFSRDDAGAVIVEFALVMPFFMLMVFGIIDFSRAYYQLNTLNSALREGARFGSTLGANYNTQVGRDSVKVRMRNFSGAFGTPVDTSKVTVGWTTQGVTVSVTNYPFNLLTPLPKFVGRSQLLMSRSANFRWERSS